MKTSELTGAALNWAVGKAEGLDGWLAPVNYCGKWEHGGPIIEREGIMLVRYTAVPILNCGPYYWKANQTDGPTPLIAAMRCYVERKLGDEVNVPKELP